MATPERGWAGKGSVGLVGIPGARRLFWGIQEGKTEGDPGLKNLRDTTGPCPSRDSEGPGAGVGFSPPAPAIVIKTKPRFGKPRSWAGLELQYSLRPP